MDTPRQLRIELLKDENNFERISKSILNEIKQFDEHACLLPVNKAMASRSLIKKLWDFLPGEQDSIVFNDIEEQTLKGLHTLPATDLAQRITLHLGWDCLSFSCTLSAAWNAWDKFCLLSTETYNCCIYPNDLDWFIVRAGINLYPMTFTNEEYILQK